MASCSLRASNIKLSRLDFGKARAGKLQQWNGITTSVGRRQLEYAGLTISHDSKKISSVRCCSTKETGTAMNGVDGIEETKSSGLISQLIPNSSEVETLVTEICNTTSVAEFELKVGGFRLYLTRNVTQKSNPPPVPTLAPLPSISPDSAPAPDTLSADTNVNGSASSTSLAISKPEPFSGGVQSFLDSAADEGLTILQSPRVGFFRRSRTIKGKRAPPSCKEKQIVKEGQVVCYIEQLGGELPIESDVSGEVIRILREDGEPVGYGDSLIAILPSFPGIKKL